MKIIRNILILVLILTVALAVYVGTRSPEFKFERSRLIDAPKSVLFNEVNSIENWKEFSPWINSKQETGSFNHSILDSTVPTYSWEHRDFGSGQLSILDSKRDSSIIQEYQSFSPIKYKASSRWTFKNYKDKTKVTWTLSGQKNFLAKLYTLINGSLEASQAKVLERGLSKLDSVAHRHMDVYTISIDGIVEHSGGYYLYKTTSCKEEQFIEKMSSMIPEVGAYALSNNISMAGRPFVIYHKRDEVNNALIFAACIPTTLKTTASEPAILTGQLAPFKAIKVTLNGNYTNLKEAWDTALNYAREHQFNISEEGPYLETYLLNADNSSNPAYWKTELFVPIN